ncbi:MAG TPA: hypothetical protein VMC80_02210 [Patescibacteria group bacterium]|nr:hypothetical protein [Patescibacteria group bacterium]
MIDITKIVGGVKGEGKLVKAAGRYYVKQNLVSSDIGWLLGELADKYEYSKKKVKFRILIEE